MVTIARALAESRRVLVTPVDDEPHIAVESLAAEFAVSHAEGYSLVLHLHAHTAVQMTTELSRIAYELVEDAASLNPSQAVRSLRAWLEEQDDWLLVVYGARQEPVLSSLLDLSGGTVLAAGSTALVTSRPDTSFLLANRLESNDLSDLLANLQPDEATAVRSVAAFVKHSQLGLATGRAIVRHGGLDWQSLSTTLEQMPFGDLDVAPGTERLLALALDRLARTRPAEMKLLCALASFSPSVVPISAIERAGTALGSTLVANERGVDELVDELAAWNLVGRVSRNGGAESAVRIIDPVRQLLWRTLPASACRRWQHRTVAFATKALEDTRLDDLDILPLGVCAARRTLSAGGVGVSPVPAVVAALRENGFRLAADELLADPRAESGVDGDPSAALARLRVEAMAHVDRGDPGRATVVCENALRVAATMRAKGPERDPALEREAALVQLVHARAHRKNGRQAEAAEALVPLLEAGETAATIHVGALIELGEIESCRGRWSAATAAFQSVVAVSRAHDFDNPPTRLAAEIAACRMLLLQRALAEVNERIARFLESTPLPRVGAECLTSLLRIQGEARARSGEYEAAVETFQRALVIDEISGETTRWAVALDLAGLAFVAQQRGEHEEAVAKFRPALQLLVEHSGVEAERLPVILARHCKSLIEVGDIEQALEFSRRAVRLRSRRPLPSNLDLVEILQSRANVFVAAGQSAEAVMLLRRAVDVADDCSIATARERFQLRLELGKCLVECGHFEEALPVVESVAAVAPPNGRGDQVAAALNLQETILRALGQNSRADDLRRRIASIARQDRQAEVRTSSDSDRMTC